MGLSNSNKIHAPPAGLKYYINVYIVRRKLLSIRHLRRYGAESPRPGKRPAGWAMMSLKLMWFLLLLAGVAVPLTICLLPLLAGGSMFHVKLLLLLTEYG